MKKYLNWDVILAVLFMLGVVVAGVALVHESYQPKWMEDMPRFWVLFMRVVGYIDCVCMPFVFGRAIVEDEMVGGTYEDLDYVEED